MTEAEAVDLSGSDLTVVGHHLKSKVKQTIKRTLNKSEPKKRFSLLAVYITPTLKKLESDFWAVAVSAAEKDVMRGKYLDTQ